MKTIGVYYRVSTDKQDLASQKNEVEQWLNNLDKNKRPKKILEFKDEGISGKTINRPGLSKLMEAVYSGKIDTLVVYSLDRFSRHATTAIRLILNMDDAGVAFVSVTQPILNLAHENPFRRTLLTAFAEIAEIERETIVARVVAGLDAARKKGVVLGAPKKLTDDKKQQAINMRQEGQTIRSIAKELKVSVGSVVNMLKMDSSPTNSAN